MTVTEACEPELPPVSMSMGTQASMAGVSILSKLFRMSPVNVAEMSKINSHGTRFFQMEKTLAFK